jgi:hypothetical protein
MNCRILYSIRFDAFGPPDLHPGLYFAPDAILFAIGDRKTGGLTNNQQHIRVLFALGNILTTLLAASVLSWRCHPATRMGDLIYSCTYDGVADNASSIARLSWPIRSCKNLGSLPGRPYPKFSLLDRTEHAGIVSTAHSKLVEIQILHEGDAVTLAQVALLLPEARNTITIQCDPVVSGGHRAGRP